MTSPRPLLLLLALTTLFALASGTRADEEPLEWKEGEVARVADRSLSWNDLCRAAVEHLSPQLMDRKSPAFANYQTAFFDLLLDRLCREQEILISQEALAKAWADLDAQVRAKRGVSLEAAMRERWVPKRAQERDLVRGLRLEALTEAGVDAGAAWAAADMKRALPTVEHPDPVDLGEGIVGSVDGTPISEVSFGDRLLSYAGPQLAAEILDRACRTLLVDSVGATLDDAALEAELAHLAKLAPLEAQFDPEEVWKIFTVREGAPQEASWTEAHVRRSAFARSLLGLIRRARGRVSESDARGAWDAGRESLYGPHVQVTNVEVEFQTAGDVFAGGPRRTRADARSIARRARLLLEKGATADEVARDVGAADTPGVTVRRLRLYPTNQNLLLWDKARALSDGETGTLLETLSAWHAIRRETAAPAPTFEEVEPVVRERLARTRAKAWLEETLTDASIVRRRWPPPQIR